jgi:alpha-ketoglutarate-dependent taurine dioxygenase
MHVIPLLTDRKVAVLWPQTAFPKEDHVSNLGDHLVPTAGNIGARLLDFDLRRLTADGRVSELAAAVDRYGVVFVPAQYLTRDEQVDLAYGLGDLAPSHPWLPPLDGYPSIRPLITGGARDESPSGRHRAMWRRPIRYSEWHADVTPVINPPAYNVLCADAVTDRGGDTAWASTTAAYSALSPALRDLVDVLTAEHRYSVGYVPMGVSDPAVERVRAAGMVARHPVVRVLATGQRALYVNPTFTSHVLELTPVESAALLDLLYYHMTQSEFTVRYSWEVGDVAVWDNRRCIHAAPEDHEALGQTRVMYRVMTVGDVPVGVDGHRSSSDEPRSFRLREWDPR